MTLRYAMLTQQNVKDSYFKAIESIEKNLSHFQKEKIVTQLNPVITLNDLIKALKQNKSSSPGDLTKKYTKLIRKISLLKLDFEQLGI